MSVVLICDIIKSSLYVEVVVGSKRAIVISVYKEDKKDLLKYMSVFLISGIRKHCEKITGGDGLGSWNEIR